MHKCRLSRSFKLLQTIYPQNELLSRVIPLRTFWQQEEFASSPKSTSSYGYDGDNVTVSAAETGTRSRSTGNNNNNEENWDQEDSFDFADVPLERKAYNASEARAGPELHGRRSDMRFRVRQTDDFTSRLSARDWTSAELGSFEKNFYVSHPSISARTQEEVDKYYEEHSITISRGEKPLPIRHFEEANFPEHINQRLKRTGWSEPTPIQSIGWPLALSGRNLVGIAQTGSGKTLGFLLPALVHIKHQGPLQSSGSSGEPIVVVLAPTRELAQQIHGVATQYCRPMGIRSCCIFGGQSKMRQAQNLLDGVDLVVATPGRMIDFLVDGVIDLKRTTNVILDEADRMLDMGFEPQIRSILSQIRPDRQILMWTATWPEEIQSLAHDFLGDFIQVNIGSTELTVNPNIRQTFRVCSGWRAKAEVLLTELQSLCIDSESNRLEKMLIFVNTQRHAEIIASQLRRRRISAREIHGGKSQSYRNNVLYKFRTGQINVLVATDVAARGLDVDDIKVVVNYSLPNTIDSYIHRIGRTARASKTGIALSLCSTEDSNLMPALISLLKRSKQDVETELERLSSLVSRRSYKKGGSGYGRQRGGFGSSYGRQREDFDGGYYNRRKDDLDSGYGHQRDDFVGGYRGPRNDFERGYAHQRDNFNRGYGRPRDDDFERGYGRQRGEFNKGYRHQRDEHMGDFDSPKDGYYRTFKPARDSRSGGHFRGSKGDFSDDDFGDHMVDLNLNGSGTDGIAAPKHWTCSEECSLSPSSLDSSSTVPSPRATETGLLWSCGHKNLFWRKTCTECRAPKPSG